MKGFTSTFLFISSSVFVVCQRLRRGGRPKRAVLKMMGLMPSSIVMERAETFSHN